MNISTTKNLYNIVEIEKEKLCEAPEIEEDFSSSTRKKSKRNR